MQQFGFGYSESQGVWVKKKKMQHTISAFKSDGSCPRQTLYWRCNRSGQMASVSASLKIDVGRFQSGIIVVVCIWLQCDKTEKSVVEEEEMKVTKPLSLPVGAGA